MHTCSPFSLRDKDRKRGLESGNYLHHTLPLRNPLTEGEGFNEAALVYYRSMIFSRPKNLS